jgi:hypothetical protein
MYHTGYNWTISLCLVVGGMTGPILLSLSSSSGARGCVKSDRARDAISKSALMLAYSCVSVLLYRVHMMVLQTNEGI